MDRTWELATNLQGVIYKPHGQTGGRADFQNFALKNGDHDKWIEILSIAMGDSWCGKCEVLSAAQAKIEWEYTPIDNKGKAAASSYTKREVKLTGGYSMMIVAQVPAGKMSKEGRLLTAADLNRD